MKSNITFAVLLTCFNRKEKTLAALAALFVAKNKYNTPIELNIYLTDDGSSDGTATAVKKAHPEVNILQGNGQLFWAGGMRTSWNEALKGDYDMYLLLNDDTLVYKNLFEELMTTHQKIVSEFEKGGIYLGSTQDPKSKKLTYGGAKLQNKFMLKYKHIEPNGSLQHCELGNANIMFVAKNIVNKIGVLSTDYVHGVADYDYTLRAVKEKLPVVVMPNFCGVCENEHSYEYEGFANKTFKERIQYLKSPIGLDFKSNLNLMKNHFPIRVPFFIASAIAKVLLPKLYTSIHKSR